MRLRNLFAAFLLSSLLLVGCKAPDFPDGELCRIFIPNPDRGETFEPYKFCFMRSNPDETWIKPISDGDMSVSAGYYADIEAYRAEMRRWIARRCK